MSDDANSEFKKAAELDQGSREAFAKAHKEGLEALRRHDRPAISKAIADETEAIEQHRKAVQQLGRVIDKSLNE
jgi:trimethylamine:corrinoid methyltransferase-like protein